MNLKTAGKMLLRVKVGCVLKAGRVWRQTEWCTNQRMSSSSSGSSGSSTGSERQPFNIWQWTTFGLGLLGAYLMWKENWTKHDYRYVNQVISHLSEPFAYAHDGVKDIPELKFVERDTRSMGELKRILAMSGGLTLLEGPSGCGKTTAVQHSLVDTMRSGVYFSVRDSSSGRSPLAAFALAFGIHDLPETKWIDSLDIIRNALESLHEQETRSHRASPVLVIDDVQQLLKLPTFTNGGQSILEWCLGRAANQELTVLFISSEAVQSSMRELSGYAARLRVPDTVDYIDPEKLKVALRDIQGKLAFTEEEADRVIRVLGTHMSDIRRLQRRRNEVDDEPASCDSALGDLVTEEIQLLHEQLSPAIDSSLSDHSLVRIIIGKMVCDHLAESNGGVSVFQLLEVIKASFANSKWQVDVAEFESIIDGLVGKNILRRYYRPQDHREYLAFYRPVQQTAYRRLSESQPHKHGNGDGPGVKVRRGWFFGWF